MYGLKLVNGAVVGHMSLVAAYWKWLNYPEVVRGVVRLVDFKQLRPRH